MIVLWLSSVVRAEKILITPASNQEKAIYGLGLLRLGAFHEAEQILTDVDAEKDPQVYFYRASLSMNQWNYIKAIPNLKKYIHHPDVVPYSKLVGRLNLCAALISSGTSTPNRIASEVDRLMNLLNRKNITLLKGNLLEIRSQWLIEQKDYNQALNDLNEAATILQKADEQSLIYIEKWRLIIKSKTSRNPLSLVDDFKTLQQRAIAIKNWETVRDCDLHLALILKNSELIQKVYWGTRFPSYKKRIQIIFKDFKIENQFVWKNSDTDTTAKSFDLVQLAPTKTLQKLFFILSRELYQPLQITEIIDSLYPNEYFHPVASPARLHRLIARARLWLTNKKLPLQIQSYRNSYRLELIGPAQIILHASLSTEKMMQLPHVVKKEFFNVAEWAQELKISKRTARHQILQLAKQGRIESFLRGPNTKYRLKSRF